MGQVSVDKHNSIFRKQIIFKYYKCFDFWTAFKNYYGQYI